MYGNWLHVEFISIDTQIAGSVVGPPAVLMAVAVTV